MATIPLTSDGKQEVGWLKTTWQGTIQKKRTTGLETMDSWSNVYDTLM